MRKWPLPKDFSLSANIGRTAFNDNLAVGAEDYTDWNVSVSKTIGIADVALAITAPTVPAGAVSATRPTTACC